MRSLSFTTLTSLLTSGFFFFNDTATTEIYTLSLHDALPIWKGQASVARILARNSAQQKALSAYQPKALLARRCSQAKANSRSEEHTSELQSRLHLVCRLLLEKKKSTITNMRYVTHGPEYLCP